MLDTIFLIRSVHISPHLVSEANVRGQSESTNLPLRNPRDASTIAFARPSRAAGPESVGIDYAYYNPPSLVLKQNGWLETALDASGTRVEWVLSLGSNKANGFLAANAIQFGSTTGSAALLARANGTPIRTIFLYLRPEWTALVIAKIAPYKNVADLRGKKIAATKGTDPYFFLLRALRDAKLEQSDVEILDVQHPDGRAALERGDVDAWAGLDPHMAASELDAGSRLLYRNVAYNTFGAVNAREDFLKDHPDTVRTVLLAYARAHAFAAHNVDATAKIVAAASNLELRVADRQLKLRTTYPDPTPGKAYRDALAGVVPIVRENGLVVPGTDVDGALASLADPAIAREAPSLLVGARIGLTQAWLFLVAAELLGATRGLGFLLTEGHQISRTDEILTAIVLLAICGKISESAMRALESRMLYWTDGMAR